MIDALNINWTQYDKRYIVCGWIITLFTLFSIIAGGCKGGPIVYWADPRDVLMAYNKVIAAKEKKPSEEVIKYTGHKYNIGIVSFKNMSPASTVGLGEEATEILRQMLISDGLNPLLLATLSDSDLSGTDIINFRISGSIKYNESDDNGNAGSVYTNVNLIFEDMVLNKTILTKSFKSTVVADKAKPRSKVRKYAIQKSLLKAMDEITTLLNNRPRLSKIINIVDNKVILLAGTDSGFAPGTLFETYNNKNKEISSSKAKLILKNHNGKKTSVVKLISGAGVSKGDIVKVIEKR